MKVYGVGGISATPAGNAKVKQTLEVTDRRRSSLWRNRIRGSNIALDFPAHPRLATRFPDSLLTLIKRISVFTTGRRTDRSRNTGQAIVFISVLKAFYLIAASTYNAYT